MLRNMSEVSRAEDYLVKEGLVKKSHPTRESILGCLGCIWAQREQTGQAPFATMTEINACSGKANSSLSHYLNQLKDTETLSAQVKLSGAKSTPQLQYAPGDNEQGQWLRAALGKKEDCKYTVKEPVAATEGTIVPEQTPAGVIGVIRDRRLELSILQKDFCQVTGVDQATYSKQETLKNGMGIDDLLKYAGALGLRVVLEPVENPAENIPLPPAPDQAGEA